MVTLMATKADFTEEEWKMLQEGITGAGMLVALSEPGFFDTFKEANAMAKHLAEAHSKSDNELVREVASGHERPFGITSSRSEVEKGTVAPRRGRRPLGQGAGRPARVPPVRPRRLRVCRRGGERHQCRRGPGARGDPHRPRAAVAP
jgi:hypothetical protein